MNPEEILSLGDFPILSLAIKITLVLGMAWIAAMVMRRRNPMQRVFLLRFTMVAVLALPIVSAFAPSIALPLWQRSVLPSTAELPMIDPEQSLGIEEDIRQSPNNSLSKEREADALTYGSMLWRAQQSVSSSGWTLSPRTIIFGLWLAGVISILLYTGLRDRQIKRFLRRSTSAPEWARQELETVCDQMGIIQEIGLRCLKEALTPFLYGIRRPTIVIPPRVLEEEFRDDLPAVLAHELSHVRSHDLAWKSGFRWMQALLWFNPLAWLVRISHDSVCEELSDAKAALYVGCAQSYSQTLARVTLDLLTNPPVYAGLSMARLPEIRRRLEILKYQIALSPLSRSLTYSLALAGGIFLTGLAGLHVVSAETTATTDAFASEPFDSLHVGETWTYSHVGCRTGGNYIGNPVHGDRVRKVVGTTGEGDQQRWLLQEIWGIDDYDPCRAFLDENRLVYQVEEGADILTFEPAVEWDWIHLKPGESITVETIAKDSANQGIFILQATRLPDETLRVPAGTFEHCQKIKVVMSYTPPNQSKPQAYGDMTAWYHPQANGLVKENVVFSPIGGADDQQTRSGTSMLKSHVVPQS